MISGLFNPVPERKEYNTDYILVKSENFERAMSILKEHGYQEV